MESKLIGKGGSRGKRKWRMGFRERRSGEIHFHFLIPLVWELNLSLSCDYINRNQLFGALLLLLFVHLTVQLMHKIMYSETLFAVPFGSIMNSKIHLTQKLKYSRLGSHFIEKLMSYKLT